MPDKLLVVDDDKTLLRFLEQYLVKDGFEVITASSGSRAMKTFYEMHPDLVILDIMMPGMDGWEVCARIREMADTPIIFLTAKSDESDKLRGFRLGVDDFVVKPFSLPELAARARAVLSRTTKEEREFPQVRFGDIIVDLRRREARRKEQLLDLTPTEYRLVAALCRRLGEAVSHQKLILEVWGAHYDPSGGSLRRFVWLLRQKIEENPKAPKHIVTVRGYGYRLDP
jgi:two-component system KDP operon response regulator KdpE